MHILLPETDNCPSWISGRDRMTVQNISWSISTKECCRPWRGLNPRPPGLQSDGASNWVTEAVMYLVVFLLFDLLFAFLHINLVPSEKGSTLKRKKNLLKLFPLKLITFQKGVKSNSDRIAPPESISIFLRHQLHEMSKPKYSRLSLSRTPRDSLKYF